MKKLIVKENERVIKLVNGVFDGILMPGKYRFFDLSNAITFEVHSLSQTKIQSGYIDQIVQKYPEAIKDHVVVVESTQDQAALVYVNSKIYDIIAQGNKGYYWKDAGVITYDFHNVKDSLFVAEDKVALLKDFYLFGTSVIQQVSVPSDHIALLYVDNVFHTMLPAGLYYLWTIGRIISTKIIDLRLTETEITGQEVLTKDKVTIRVNLVCYYQVLDPQKAVTEVADYKERLYKELQFAVRKAVESKTLDELLESKSTLDSEMYTFVYEVMEKFGITVSKITVKDTILPGEMREILNQVILAEKLAQANLIKRREETAATRSLLNTAKLMDDHPTLLRLKELESLETILQKVDNLSIYGGVENLIGKLFEQKK